MAYNKKVAVNTCIKLLVSSPIGSGCKVPVGVYLLQMSRHLCIYTFKSTAGGALLDPKSSCLVALGYLCSDINKSAGNTSYIYLSFKSMLSLLRSKVRFYSCQYACECKM